MMSAMASQITSLTIVYSTFYSGADQRKHQSSASQAFVRGIHRWPVTSPQKGPVTRKMFLFDDIIMMFFSMGYLLLFTVILNKPGVVESLHIDALHQASCGRFPGSDLIFRIALVVDGYGICFMTEKPVEQTPFQQLKTSVGKIIINEGILDELCFRRFEAINIDLTFLRE